MVDCAKRDSDAITRIASAFEILDAKCNQPCTGGGVPPWACVVLMDRSMTIAGTNAPWSAKATKLELLVRIADRLTSPTGCVHVAGSDATMGLLTDAEGVDRLLACHEVDYLMQS